MIPIPPLLAVLAAALLGTGCTHTTAPLPTVTAIGLERYAGRWYKIAHLPNRFQAQCVSDTRATCAQDKDRITVLNECRVADAVEGSGNARLRVRLFRSCSVDYGPDALSGIRAA